MTTFTIQEQQYEQESGLTYYRTTTYTEGKGGDPKVAPQTYQPIRTHTKDEVGNSKTRITNVEKWYDKNNQLHAEDQPAIITYLWTINEEGELIHTGEQNNTHLYHGWTPEEAASIAYGQNEISEEEYHLIVHPEKGNEMIYSEIVAILNKAR